MSMSELSSHINSIFNKDIKEVMSSAVKCESYTRNYVSFPKRSPVHYGRLHATLKKINGI